MSLSIVGRLFARVFDHGYRRVPGLMLCGARVYVHWSVIALAIVLLIVWFRQPLHAIECVCCYFALILLHEAGHALMARRLGYSVWRISLSAIHGNCSCDPPDTSRDECLIAWGGVIAQLAIAVPVIALTHFSALATLPYMGIFILVFGYYSVFVAGFNLTPTDGLDGAKAWRLFPILFSDLRARRDIKKATRALFKRLR